ncbi:sulfite exporter TauE/SafE family protein [Geodermatophilus marinus]|uniref:sulfite exporter TauE/SafE family protein n=1 Tax=Geodermatophilus sp. LHW52908 TaxID=2303986 RepID=UPI000E3CE1C7|nr:sulfite exporter TauE/SafE family protein [Geodermatophilus sp. LHW52908]RFU20565.1 sulfite exporter TauE/SafE family protein [Geodermatophilus sp. LHW52908]
MTLLDVGAVALLVFTVAAAAQAVTGFGLALVAVPLMAVIIDPVAAVVVTTMVGLVLTGLASYRERQHVEAPVAARLTGAALLGMPLGLLTLTLLDERSLELVIAVGLLLLVGLLLVRVPLPAGAVTQYGAGVVSGMLLTSTGMNGPPVVLSLQALHLPPRRFRGTLQVVFCAQDLVAVVAFVALGHVDPVIATAVLAGVAGVPAGWWVGDRLFGLLPPERFRGVVLSTLTVTALVALSAAVA